MVSVTLRAVVDVLDRMPAHFEAVDVFADDLDELKRSQPQFPDEWTLIDAAGPLRFDVNVAGARRLIEVYQDAGIVRVLRQTSSDPTRTATGAAIGAMAGAVIAASASKKTNAWLPGLLLGLLVGGVAASATEKRPSVLAVQFDPETNQWRTYDGGLLRWAHTNLLPPSQA